jgi:hypothetical protein
VVVVVENFLAIEGDGRMEDEVGGEASRFGRPGVGREVVEMMFRMALGRGWRADMTWTKS